MKIPPPPAFFRPAIKLVLCLVLLMAVSGCWDQNEIEDLGIVQGIGIDRGDEKDNIRLLVQVVDPKAAAGGGGEGGAIKSQQSGGGTAYRNFAADGKSMLHAFRELSHVSARELFYAHTQVVVISEALARENNVMEFLDFLDRSEQVRRQVWFLVAQTEMRNIFDITAPLETTPSMRMFGIIEARHLNSHYGVNRLGDFLKLLQGEGVEAYTAGVDLKPNRGKSFIEQTDEPLQEISIANTAVFKKGRLVGWLNRTESRGLLWVRNEVEGGALVVPCPGGGNEDGEITLNILRSRTRIEPEITGGDVRIRVLVEAESNIDEAGCPVELNKPETLKRIEELQNEAITREISLALDRLQGELETDTFGFGNAVFKKDPDYWRQVKPLWDEIYPGLEVDVHVKSRVRRTGLVVNPAEPE